MRVDVTRADGVKLTDAGMKVSGTKVLVSISTAVWENQWPEGEGDPVYTDGIVNDATLTIGGRVIEGVPFVGGSYGGLVRFATTEFPNGQVPIMLRVNFRVGIEGVLEEEPTEYENLFIYPEVYNRAQFLATQEEWDDTAQQYIRPSTLDPWKYAYGSQTAMGLIRPQQFENSAEHIGVPAEGSEDDLHESDLDTGLGVSTLFFGYTHGETDRFRSSFDDGVSTNGDDQLLWSEVATYTARDVAIPVHNMVVLYACNILQNQGQSPSPAAAFGIGALPENQALASFKDTVWSVVDNNSGQRVVLSNHANLLASVLSTGESINDALNIVNGRYKTLDFFQQPNNNPMVISQGSDPMARIVNVYVSQSESTTYPESQWKGKWYLVLQP